MVADFKSTLVDTYLVKVDRASMLASLEIRCPWLDHKIIEFAFSKVPDALRLRGNNKKILPKLLAQNFCHLVSIFPGNKVSICPCRIGLRED